MTPSVGGTRAKPRNATRLRARARIMRRRAGKLPPAVHGMFWMLAAGMLITTMNATLRKLTLALDPLEAQFLRYVFGLIVMMPLVLRYGWHRFRAHNVRGQFVRGGVHTLALALWFIALPHMPLADTTAIGFTAPIFIMIGAAIFFGEAMRWDRWVAALIGFAGIAIVVGPELAGTGGVYTLVMMASSPVLAASFLLTKSLTRYESAPAIVLWQAITVTILTLPLALPNWQWPTGFQWLLFALTGVIGTAGQYSLTRAFAAADISASQPVKFLDLVWASALGWMLFSDEPSMSTLIGGSVICASTVWIARREAQARRSAAQAA